MLRLTIALFHLTSLLARADVQKLGRQNFTSEWLIVTKESLYPPMVTKVQDHLVFVTFTPDYSIKLESSRLENKPCEIQVPMIKEHRAKDVAPAYAEALGDDSVLVALIESRSGHKREPNDSTVWLYLVEPRRCSYSFSNFSLDAPLPLARDSMTLVPYKRGFDVFVKSEAYCGPGSICNLRFGNDLVMLNQSSRLRVPYEDEGWDIITKKDFDASDGYLYVVIMSRSNSTILRHLEANFSLSRESLLNYGDSLSYWYDDDGGASSCFRLGEQEIDCLLLEPLMGLERRVSLYYDGYLAYYSIFRGFDGDTLVLTILSNEPDGSDPATYVQRVSRAGKVSPPLKFQDFICENVYEMNAFRMRDGLVCVSTICQSVVNTKCIGPEEDRQF